jgi:hypothetical protein
MMDECDSKVQVAFACLLLLNGGGANILYSQWMLFAGFPGVATAVGLFASVWLFVYLTGKGKPIVFDPGGKHGEFGKRLLPMYRSSRHSPFRVSAVAADAPGTRLFRPSL